MNFRDFFCKGFHSTGKGLCQDRSVEEVRISAVEGAGGGFPSPSSVWEVLQAIMGICVAVLLAFQGHLCLVSRESHLRYPPHSH